MKKINLIFVLILLTGCSKPEEEFPTKEKPYSFFCYDSPVNVNNIDSFLFRGDCQYVDVRNSEWVFSDGYIAGFEFIQFWNFLVGYDTTNSLFQASAYDRASGEYVGLCYSGTFRANYLESEELLKDLFDLDKNIILISQSGAESHYTCNLLQQYGYNPNKLYNIGAFKIGEGMNDIPYAEREDSKYLVSGNFIKLNISYDFSSLTRKE